MQYHVLIIGGVLSLCKSVDLGILTNDVTKCDCPEGLSMRQMYAKLVYYNFLKFTEL